MAQRSAAADFHRRFGHRPWRASEAGAVAPKRIADCPTAEAGRTSAYLQDAPLECRPDYLPEGCPVQPFFRSLILLACAAGPLVSASASEPETVPTVAPPPPPLLAAPRGPRPPHSANTLHAGELTTQAATVQESADLVQVSGTAQRAEVQCKGRAAEITGDYLVVEIGDNCGALKVRGNANVIRVHAATRIEVNGDDNAVTWNRYPEDATGRRQPTVFQSGAHNLIVPGD